MKLSPFFAVLFIALALIAETGCTTADLAKGHYWSTSDNTQVAMNYGGNKLTIGVQNNSAIWKEAKQIVSRLAAAGITFGPLGAQGATAELAAIMDEFLSRQTNRVTPVTPTPTATLP